VHRYVLQIKKITKIIILENSIRFEAIFLHLMGKCKMGKCKPGKYETGKYKQGKCEKENVKQGNGEM
jgi:hypothetical protein